jgi:AmmeMemoRadiSam system protein B
MIRPPAVAGRFYAGDPARLREQVAGFLTPLTQEGTLRARACLVPHAGYMYSGHVAGAVYRRLEIPATVILIGPRHFPRGAPLAILTEGSWQTPLGPVQINQGLGKKVASACHLLREDAIAHSAEHSLEVQLPFLQCLAPTFTFVPIVVGTARYPELEELGHAVAAVILAEETPPLLIASSDMNHYESDEITRVKDHKAIDRILALDPLGLFETVRDQSISMCGYAAVVATSVASRDLGASKVELLKYATSGDVSGDLREVVGYAGMIIS